MRHLVALALLCLCLHYADSVAVMSVDLGSQFMKIAIVKPGVPMEIVLNKESRRKTPAVVSMRDGERLFGDAALATQVKKPKQAFWYVRDLLGKTASHPDVKLFKERFPYYTLETAEGTGLVSIRIDSETVYTAEELIAMLLEHAKELAEEYAEQPIKDAVVTVPSFWGQAERRALSRAAGLAGMNLLQLMGEDAAAALNYGVFRRKFFNSTAQYYMFYNMGAGSTTAVIASYQVVKMREGELMLPNPQVTIKGVGYDRTLGGLAFQLRLRDHMVAEFKKQQKITGDLTPRAMAKLFKEAGRVKQVLSANNNHHAHVESLQDDKDFKLKVTREGYEKMCADLFDRAAGPIKQAIAASDLHMDVISEVILMGAGTRVPQLQQIVREATGRSELGKSINTDEAAALGAVYQAAYLSKGFRVKTFGVKEANLMPIVVEFERQKASEDEEARKVVTRTLFARNNPFPQKKVMTFNKHTTDFSFNISLGDLSYLTEEQSSCVQTTLLETVDVTGVEAGFAKHADKDSKGIKAHFGVDDSGLLFVDKVELVFETLTKEEDEKEEESTLSKLGSTISNFFGGSEDKEEGDAKTEEKKDGADSTDKKSEGGADAKPKEGEKAQKKEEEKKDKETTAEEPPKKEEKKKEETKKKKDKKEKKEKKKDEKKDDKKKTDSKTEDKDKSAKNETAAEEKKPKIVRVQEDLTTAVKSHGIPNPSDDMLKQARKALKKLKEADTEKRDREKALNDLESFIVNTQDKLYQEDFEKCSTEDEREKYRAALSAASDWLYELEANTEAKVYKDKRKELKAIMKDWFDRVRELRKRPEALKTLKDMLNSTEFFLDSILKLSAKDSMESPFTDVEITSLEKLINETKAWEAKSTKEQKKAALSEAPKLTVADVAVKVQSLDREIKYLLNKAKTFKPKPKPKANATETADGNSTKTATEGEADTKKTEKGDKKAEETKEKTKEETKEETKEAGQKEDPLKEPPTDAPSSQDDEKKEDSEGDKETTARTDL